MVLAIQSLYDDPNHVQFSVTEEQMRQKFKDDRINANGFVRRISQRKNVADGKTYMQDF